MFKVLSVNILENRKIVYFIKLIFFDIKIWFDYKKEVILFLNMDVKILNSNKYSLVIGLKYNI